MAATKELKRLIALQLASGHSVKELAEHHNYTYNGMRNLCRRPEVQLMVAEERQHMQEVYTRIWFRYAENGEALAAGMLEDAFNPDSPKQFEARKYCLDQLSPAKQQVTHDGRIDVNVNVAAEVLMGLKQSMDNISAVRHIPVPGTNGAPAHLGTEERTIGRLQEGRDAIPTVDLVAEDGGPPPPPRPHPEPDAGEDG